MNGELLVDPLSSFNRPFHGFFQHGKFAKFEGDMLETGEDTAPQSRETLYTFVWWEAQISWFRQALEGEGE